MKTTLKKINKRITDTALACDRNPKAIRLVAVSKTVSENRIKEAIDAGVSTLGESYIQEARKKFTNLSPNPVSWHFIGHLQSNKAKYAVKIFDLIHSVDSVKLANALSREAAKINKIQDILIQVNTGREKSKSGVSPEKTIDIIKEISELTDVRINGLMTIPPLYNEPQKVSPYFRMLRELSDTIKTELPEIEMKELSMGMTGDFEVAIKEGATLVRVGTAIFGERL